MRLLAAIVSNYRIHQRLAVEFHPGVTVVAGLNETGKSTLIEALHRCLFLSHRSGGELQKAMRSRHGGQPQVELRFHAAGSEWRLVKTFAGQSGTAQLVREASSERWESEQAEEKLAELTGRAVASGRSSQKELDRSWEHLWVRQGCSHLDPLSQIDPADLEAALDSRLDVSDRLLLANRNDKLVQVLETSVEAEWKKNRKELRVDGEAGRLEAQLHECATELEAFKAAQERRAEQVSRLAQVRTQHGHAGEELQRLEHETEELAAAMKALDGADEELGRAAVELAAHAKEAETFAGLAEQLDSESAKLLAATAAVRTHADKEGSLRQQQAESAAQLEQIHGLQAGVDARLDDVRNRRELAALRREEATSRTRLARLLESQQAWEAHKHDLRETEDKLARMPQLDEERIEALEELEKAARDAQARLEGAAARVQLLAGGASVTLDGKPLAADALELVVRPAELRHADGTTVRILPGGEDLATLASSRKEVEERRKQLQLELGLEQATQARRLHAERAAQEAQLAQLRKQAKKLEDPGTELGTLETRLDILAERLLELERGGVRAEPGDDTEVLDTELAALKERQKELAEEQAGLRNGIRASEQELARSQAARAQAGEEKAKLEGSVQQLARQLGDDEQRRSNLDAKRRKEEELLGRHQQAKDKSERLSSLREMRSLQVKALEKQRSTHDKAAGEIDALERELLGDVGQDPGARLDELRARQVRLTARASAARARAEADLLLQQLCDDVRRQAKEVRLAPFVKACSDFLAVAYGAPVRLGFDEEGGKTSTGGVDRHGAGLGNHAFDELSHGTREFTGLAVRLALAEVLAAENPDRCLPVVLDDAAANIDPERFRQVGFLLAKAASHGVQVVFATCNVDEAPRLRGDDVVYLQRPSPPVDAKPARSTYAEEGDGEDRESGEEANPADLEHAARVLQDAGGSASTRAWRAALGWDEARFSAARTALSERGVIDQLPGTRTWQLRAR